MRVVVVWLALLLAAAPAYTAWTDGPPLPAPRSEVGVAADDARVYVVGGNGPHGPVAGGGCRSGGDGMNTGLIVAAALMLVMMRRPGS